MARSESYNTKQKDTILNATKYQKQEFTIKDIYNKVKEKTELTTIYIDRLIN